MRGNNPAAIVSVKDSHGATSFLPDDVWLHILGFFDVFTLLRSYPISKQLQFLIGEKADKLRMVDVVFMNKTERESLCLHLSPSENDPLHRYTPPHTVSAFFCPDFILQNAKFPPFCPS